MLSKVTVKSNLNSNGVRLEKGMSLLKWHSTKKPPCHLY